MKLGTVSIIAAFLLAVPVSAQGLYITDGFGAEAGFASQDGIATIEGRVGYAVSGMFDVGISVSRTDDSGLAMLGIAPEVTFYPVRQSVEVPVTAFLIGSYSFLSFSGDEIDFFDALGIDLSGSGYTLGVGLARMFAASTKMDIVAKAAFGYNNLTIKADDGSISEEESDSFTSGTLGLDFAFSTTGGVFHVGPQLGFSDGQVAFGASLGMALGR